MSQLADLLVCRCPSADPEHRPGCELGRAEPIAAEAADMAAVNGDHQLLTALTALVEAGLLRDVDAPRPPSPGHDPVPPDGVLLSILDGLYEVGLIGPTEAGEPS